MKKSELYNSQNFDFNRLRLDGKLIQIESENAEYAFNTCGKCIRDKRIVGLIKEIGYGEGVGIGDFIKITRRLKYYRAACHREKNIKTILMNFLYLDLPRFVPLNRSTPSQLAQSFVYLQKELKNSKRDKIIIFENIDLLQGSGIGTLARLVSDLRGAVGMVLTIGAEGYEVLKRKGQKNEELITLLTNVEWQSLPPPNWAELAKYCISRGVLHDRLVKSLIENNQDFGLLEKAIDSMADNLRTKGYFK